MILQNTQKSMLNYQACQELKRWERCDLSHYIIMEEIDDN